MNAPTCAGSVVVVFCGPSGVLYHNPSIYRHRDYRWKAQRGHRDDHLMSSVVIFRQWMLSYSSMGWYLFDVFFRGICDAGSWLPGLSRWHLQVDVGIDRVLHQIKDDTFINHPYFVVGPCVCSCFLLPIKNRHNRFGERGSRCPTNNVTHNMTM